MLQFYITKTNAFVIKIVIFTVTYFVLNSSKSRQTFSSCRKINVKCDTGNKEYRMI